MEQRAWRRAVATPWLWAPVTIVYVLVGQPVNWFWNAMGLLFWAWVAVWAVVGGVSLARGARRTKPPPRSEDDADAHSLSMGPDPE